jgi:hypothetical protein
MTSTLAFRGHPGRLAVALVAALALAGCVGGDDALLGKGQTCVDDSPNCVSERSQALSGLMADKNRAWVHQTPHPAAYASGVRLFAFKQQKRQLSCEELSAGKREAEAGPSLLRGPSGKGLTPAQISRGVMLSTEVARELDSELRRRCKV